ncbi:hypothetical protein JHK87_028249 [Glycine soja]|nr:hypothetical protein JHK87_028249 [Glycine soja]
MSHKENKNVIEFLDEQAFYYDEEDEQWFKEKDDQWTKNIPCYKEDATKVVLNSIDFDFDMQDLDEFLKVLDTEDSSPERVPDRVVPVTPPISRRNQVPSPPRVHAPAPQRVYTFANLVSATSAPIARVPASQESPEETFNDIASGQVHAPISHQHHLLPQNMESNRVMLAGDSSRSVPCKKYTHWTREEHISFLLELENVGKKSWTYISQKIVPSKNLFQVASHAQKYFKRNNIPKKKRKRKNIHDINLIINLLFTKGDKNKEDQWKMKTTKLTCF